MSTREPVHTGVVIFVQYSNPIGYPPVQHSSGILAERGWLVYRIGVRISDVLRSDASSHPRISTLLVTVRTTTIGRRLSYFRFVVYALVRICLTPRAWVYACDALAAPVGLLASYLPGVRVVYHEHDAPSTADASALMAHVIRLRNRLLARATAVITPNVQRGLALSALAPKPIEPLCVWNCPRSHEAAVEPPPPVADGTFRVIYQGSIVPARVPMALIDALHHLPAHVHLRLVGYETAGSLGYVASLVRRAETLGVRARLDVSMAEPTRQPPSRAELLEAIRASHVGLSLFPLEGLDMNERHMTGASNKAFEYLAQGIPLLVSDLPDWREVFVSRGLARACDPEQPVSLAEAISWFVSHDAERRAMGEQGQRLIRDRWNYEQQFAPVVEVMSQSR